MAIRPSETAASHSRFTWVVRRAAMPAAVVLGLILLIALIGVAQRMGFLGRTTAKASVTDSQEGTIFTCPMHPQIRQPTPGRCPICGMELVPAAAAGGANLDELAIRIAPAQRRLANIETAAVERSPLQATLQTIGGIAIDESRQATIAAYIPGRLERLFADYTGVVVAKGNHLAVIYSPELYGAQVEYIQARRTAANATGTLPAVRQAQETLAANTRRRLQELGMTDAQIAELEQTEQAQSRLTIYAPQGGTVVEKLAIEGNYVEAGDPIYRIAELSTVWLLLNLFPEDAAQICFGQRVEALVQSLPGEEFVGRVAFISPTVEPMTRTVAVRVELMNEDGRLRPGDYAEATIVLPIGPRGDVYDADLAGKWISPMHPQIIRDAPGQCPICGMDLVPTTEYGYASDPKPQPESLHVPRSAVLLAGSNSVVYVETEMGRFEIRPVTIGPILRDRVVILEGLKEGDKVATAGNFLIDSQMQLAGKPSLIDPARAKLKTEPPSGPLVLDTKNLQSISGPTGEKLEQLYAAYLEIQKQLAADEKALTKSAQRLNGLAIELSRANELPAEAHKRLDTIAKSSQHLNHQELPQQRESFKAISHALLPLAVLVRGERPAATFTQFYCPMVKGGGGDWLQADQNLLNPYFGSEMLRCGEKVADLPKAEAEPARESGKTSGG